MQIKETELKIPSKSGKKIYTVIQYMLSPEPDCFLKNKKTGAIIHTFIVVASKAELKDFEEIDYE